MSPILDTLLLAWSLASAGLILAALRRSGRGEAWLAFRPQSVPRWGILDAAIAHFGVTLITVLTLSAMLESEKQDSARMELALGVGQSLAIGAIILIVARRHGSAVCRPLFSLDRRESLWRDLRLGLILAIAVVPPLLKFHQLMSTLVEWSLGIPYQHDTLDKLQRSDVSRFETAALWYRTVLVTPILEELLYRGLLLGALLGIAVRRPFDPLLALFGLPRTNQPQEAAPRAPFWPVIVSAAVFAAAHLGQGAAPISLFVFSLVLGDSVRRTGSILPAIITHLILNAWTLATVTLSSAGA